MSDTNRHDLYLSKDIWGELKHRAFLEGQTAGEVIAYLLDWAISHPQEIPPLKRYQERSRQNELDRTHRTVRGIPDELWQKAEKTARVDGRPFSISGLVEHLLRNYLGMDESPAEDSVGMEYDDPSQTGLLRTGRVIFDLGDHPAEIDLYSGKKPRSES